MSGKYTRITYEQVIASAKIACNLENTSDYDGFMELMADEAMRQIRDISLFELQTKEVELNADQSVKVPCGFIRLMGMWFKDSDNKCYGVPYVDRDIANYCGCNTSPLDQMFTGMLNGPYINFNQNIPDKYTHLSISYLGMRMDDNNMPVIPETHERCVRAYICWRVIDKMAKNQPPQMRQMMRQEGKDYQREYALQKRYLRGNAQQQAFLQDKESIGRKFNAWITRTNPMYNQ